MKKLYVIFTALAFFLGSVNVAYGVSVLTPQQGGTGTGSVPSYGQILLGTSGSVYSPTATSSVNFFTLTTSGSSGAATYSGGTLNIPQYSGGGSTFPFTIQSYGVSTSTTVGFLNGLFSTASSTFTNSVFYTGLSQGFDYIGTSGKLNTIASSSIKLSWFNNDAGFLTSLTGAASSTLLGDSNTFSGTLDSFTNAPKLGTLTGLIKGSSGTLSVGSNGTDFTLITAKTCTGSDFVSSVTAAGVFTCTTPLGTTYTGTWPITVTGSVISWSGLATSSNLASGKVHYSTGVNTFADVATSSIASGVGITVTNGSSAYVIGSQPSIACNTATASVFGCLAAADFTTFNAKQAPGFQISTSSPAIGGLPYYTSIVPTTLGNVATSAPLLGSEFTYTGGTIGYFVGGTGATLHIGAGGVSNAMLANKTIVVNGTTLTLGDAADTLTAASSTLLANNNLFSGTNMFTASTTIGGGTVTTGLTVNGTATTSNLIDTSLTSALALFDANHKETAYGGASSCGANNFFTGLSAIGASTCGTASITLNGSSVALGGSATISSTTLLANNNTFSGTNTFSTAPVLGSLTGIIKGSSGTLSAASNGTDFTLITANTCGAGNHVSAITAAGVISCTADSGGGGTWPFTPTTYGGVLAQSTTTALWLTGSPYSLLASSSILTNATTTNATTTNLFVGTDGGLNDSFLTIGPTNHEWSLQAASSSATTPYLFSIASSTNGAFPALTIDKNLLVTVPNNFTVGGTAKIGSLGGLLLGTAGTVSAYGGSAPCTNQLALSLSSTGVITCSSVTDSMFSGQLGLAHGGTNASLSGANQILTMNSGNTAVTNAGTGYTITSLLASLTNATTTALTVGNYFNLISGGVFGIASTSPWGVVGIGTGTASTSVTIAEYKYSKGSNEATSTAKTLDFRTSNQIAWPLGTAATTLTLGGAVPGETYRIIIQTPGAGTPGAITWAASAGYIISWAGGVAPTLSTTVNTMDVCSFLATQGSSTVALIGACTIGAK